MAVGYLAAADPRQLAKHHRLCVCVSAEVDKGLSQEVWTRTPLQSLEKALHRECREEHENATHPLRVARLVRRRLCPRIRTCCQRYTGKRPLATTSALAIPFEPRRKRVRPAR